MRGKDFKSTVDLFYCRITPAYAGKRKISWILFAYNLGSPPPMRGKALKTMPKQRHCRITPAYAGKSAGYQSGRCGNQDHPRLCGEKYHMPLRVSPRAGSPPPMRGKGHNRKAEKGGLRITPAYAGKSCRNRGTDCNIWDHPRLCGEKQAKHGKKIINPGSPPPMRGKVPVNTPLMFSQRITPAYAGKRCAAWQVAKRL